MPLSELLLPPLGILVGMVGSIAGVGGGFLVVPYLMLLHDPVRFTPVTAVATSLAVVVVNAASATAAQVRSRRIDWRTGWIFGGATVPGAFLGPVLLPGVPGTTFRLLFAGLLLVVSGYLLFFAPEGSRTSGLFGSPRRLAESDGTIHEYRVHLPFGIAVSAVVGFLSSMFGVGGGFIHMPVLILLFGMTPRIASACSQFILLITAAASTAVCACRGAVDVRTVVWLGAGVLAGAPLGVWVGGRISGTAVRRVLAAVLVVSAAQMAARAAGMF